MENALLILHLVLVIALIGVVLIQRSEGGALGMGGGGGGGLVTGRGAATALQKITWYLAGGFIATSLILTMMATANNQGSSVFDRVVPGEEGLPALDGDTFTPPLLGGDGADATFTPPTIGGTDGLSLPVIQTGSSSGATATGTTDSGTVTTGTVSEPSNLVPAAPTDN